jgi:hypothetical protein
MGIHVTRDRFLRLMGYLLVSASAGFDAAVPGIFEPPVEVRAAMREHAASPRTATLAMDLES